MVSHIYLSKNGTPEQNITKIIEMMGGGIVTLIDPGDIIILKPDAQWPGHGGTNTNTVKGFMDLIFSELHFKGEIIIAENHHVDPDNVEGGPPRRGMAILT